MHGWLKHRLFIFEARITRQEPNLDFHLGNPGVYEKRMSKHFVSISPAENGEDMTSLNRKIESKLNIKSMQLEMSELSLCKV